MDAAAAPLLEVVDLQTHFDTVAGTVRAVDGVSWRLDAGETLGIVGESGCGKSVSALSILRLVPTPPARHGGRVRLRGADLLRLDERGMRAIRGNRISMIFQEPMTSLNPVLSIGRQIAETVAVHGQASGRVARERAIEMLRLVQIAEPERRVDEYPHQLSGGMRQRVMIAMALACRPDILIADEPTTALDVTVQAQIFDLLRDLQREKGTAILLITHDMGAVAEMADRVMVMYAGRVIEQGSAGQVLSQPAHPYTRGLIECLPELGSSLREGRAELAEIEGVVPSIFELASGCAFRDRCPHAMTVCAESVPPMFTIEPTAGAPGGGHAAACWLHAEDRELPR